MALEGGNKLLLTAQITTRIEDEEGFTIADRVFDRIDHHWQIAADIVHDEEEDADDNRAHFDRDQLDEDGEQNAHPHLSETVSCQQANEVVRRLQQQDSGSQRRGQQLQFTSIPSIIFTVD